MCWHPRSIRLTPTKASRPGPLTNGPIAGPALPTQFSKPSFLAADPNSTGGTWVNFGGYANVTRAGDSSQVYRPGGISGTASVNGGAVGWFFDSSYFTAQSGAGFRLGIMVDAFGVAAYGVDAISIYDTSTATTIYSSPLTRDGMPDLVLFDIHNTSGGPVQYTIALHRADGSVVTGFSMLTFDALQ